MPLWVSVSTVAIQACLTALLLYIVQANVAGRPVTSEQKAAILRLAGNANRKAMPSLGPSLLYFSRGMNS